MWVARWESSLDMGELVKGVGDAVVELKGSGFLDAFAGGRSAYVITALPVPVEPDWPGHLRQREVAMEVPAGCSCRNH